MGRFSTAWKAFWAIMHSAEKAKAWNDVNATLALPEHTQEEEQPQEQAPDLKAQKDGEAVHALAILQRESRLIDFIQEDISACDDEQIGAAVRKIHDDARAALEKYFHVVPIQTATEGESVTIDEGFDNRQIRLTGKPAGAPPFTGILIHKGWRAENVNLPTTSAAVDTSVITPAEIEI